jgi:2-dehydropantoate 2-reductase
MIDAGHDVTFIDQWPDNIYAIRREGVTVIEPDGVTSRTVRVGEALLLHEVATLTHRFDIVYLITKAYDAPWATRLIAPYVADDGLLVGVQNGMTYQTIAEAVGRHRAAGAVIELGAAMFNPGVVERTTVSGRGWFAIGSPGGAVPTSTIEQAAAVLRAAGVVEVVDDILRSKWMKLSVNVAELVTSALLDIPMAGLWDEPAIHAICVEAGREAIEAGIAAGLPPKAIMGLTEADAADLDPGEYVAKMLSQVLGKYSTGATLTTVLQDWMKGRHSEYDEINGEVSRVGAEHGIPTPVNDRIVDLARAVESGDLKRGMHLTDLMTADHDAEEPTA